MKDLPRDKHGEPYFKVPRYWMDLPGNKDAHCLGWMVLRAADYAFNDKEPDHAEMTDEQWRKWQIAKRDIDYQCKHHRGIKFRHERENQKDRFTMEYRLWRKAVFKRDDFTCQSCGKVGGKLNAHHILPYASHPELRTSIENGVTLCEKCHRAVHRGEIKCPTGY